MIIFVYGPPGCGKTRNSKRIVAACWATACYEEQLPTGRKIRPDETVVVLGNTWTLAPPGAVRIGFKAMMEIVEAHERSRRIGIPPKERINLFEQMLEARKDL